MLKIANHCHYHKKLAREFIQHINQLQQDEEFVIRIEDENLTLCRYNQKQKSCFTHSFTEPKLRKRASQKNQLLLKACNNKRKEIKTVIDLTAGWGKDSFILATHGQEMTMLEQNPLIYNCLNFLINIAQHDNSDEVYQRLQV
ncbi:MAG: class I SAM-dependent methyltransferase, partial [Gammaproteobacteria bacterium]|nr:class I SAM-dependent methyltransferase [Gammaproteobacteria bacterium]